MLNLTNYRIGLKKHDTDLMDGCNETLLQSNENIYSNLNLKNITTSDYSQDKKDGNIFQIKNLGHYYDLCMQSNTSLLCDYFENYHKISLNTYDLHPFHFYSATELS